MNVYRIYLHIYIYIYIYIVIKCMNIGYIYIYIYIYVYHLALLQVREKVVTARGMLSHVIQLKIVSDKVTLQERPIFFFCVR